MAKKKNSSNTVKSPSELRAQAEEYLLKHQSALPDFPSSPEEMLKTIHELSVYQVELEMQQQELAQSGADLEKSLDKYTELYDFAPLGYLTLGRDSEILDANLTAAKLLGVERYKLQGIHFRKCIMPEDYGVFDALLDQVFNKKIPVQAEVRLAGNDPQSSHNQHFRAVQTFRIDAAISDSSNACRIILSDITEQKQSENELHRLTHTLRAITDCNHALNHITDEKELLQKICSIMVDTGGYRMVWVGYAEHNEAKRVRPVAHAGFEDGYLDAVKITWADDSHGYGPAGTAIRTGEPFTMRDIRHNPKFKPWLTEAIKRGYAAVQGFPLKVGNTVIGALTIYSETPYAFEAKEIEPLTVLVNNLAYGITVLRSLEEKQRVVDDLIENQKRFRQTLDATHAGVWEADLKTGENIWSDEIWELYGLERDSAKPSNELWQTTLHPDDRKDIIRIVEDAVQKENALTVEYRVNHLDGTVHWLKVQGMPLCNEEGLPVRYIGTCIDITDRKQADQRIEASTVKLEAALESMSDAVFISDIHGQFTDFNNAFATYHRFRNKEECARTFAEYPDILDVFMTDGELAPIEQWAVPRALRGEIATNAEYILRRKDTGETWVGSYSFAPIRNKNGEIIGSVVSARDITERKHIEEALRKSEERFRKLFENHSAIMILYDPDTGSILDANPAAVKFYGWPIEKLKLMRLQEINTYSSDELFSNIAKVRASKQSEFLVQHRRADGSVRDVEVFSNAIEIDEKTILYAIIHDITERKKAAEESDRLKAAFIANISHEIRTPMNGILGFSELLKEPNLSGEEQAEYIELIHRSGQRMLSLINDLMDISRIDANEIKLEITPTPVNKLLLDLQAFFRLQAQLKGLRLSCSPGLADSESIIQTDSLKLNQILSNLIQNALKFTPSGGIDFGYTRKDNQLEFYCIDSGIGIPAEKKERIFERFHQVDISISRNHEGAGLGLSITKSFVELLGGTIRV